ncbi:FG-GAP repeat domain-containing protein [Tunturibacter empetritectus]|uniref:VCBS repeat-containing protein n=1 Tax=Tunturiibacter lichenicola TaxID=2051959 RepID=A0A7W8J4I7_9BACT|nr:VCBS repeat-containing protein [Edaphobacter lichenicola]MBB5342442.1 hypothetical protein [Edaphobacter lichenicola]
MKRKGSLGDATFEDHTYPSGLGENTRLLGWGVGFFDMDNDGWLDILMSNAHVYPEVDKSKADLKYAEHKCLYRNLHNGRFQDVTNKGGPGILEDVPARGCVFGGYDNDGDPGYRRELYQCRTTASALRFDTES